MPANPNAPQYPFDPTGLAASNLISGEQQILNLPNFEDFHFLIPQVAPFFAESMTVSIRKQDGTVLTLDEGTDFYFTYQFVEAGLSIGKPIYGAVSFTDLTLVGVVTFNYQTLGGDWTTDPNNVTNILANDAHNPFTTTWDQVIFLPYAFPVIAHSFNITDFVGMSDVVTSINAITAAILSQAVDQSELIAATNTANAAIAAATGALANADAALATANALDPAVAQQALQDLQLALASVENGIPVQLSQQITTIQNTANAALALAQQNAASGGGGGGGSSDDYAYFLGQL